MSIDLPFAGAQRVPSSKIELYIKRDFLTPLECGALVALIEDNRRPSTIADGLGDAGFRTSETCDLHKDLAEVRAIEPRIAAFLGLDASYGEPLQGQRYDVGQEFKLHTDFFDPHGADYERYCGRHGQRTWTAMVYLNTPEAGGATRFKVIDKMFQPETGKLLCWNNRLPGGGGNDATLHQGMKVRKGVKHIITKWYREWPWAE